MGSLYRLPRGTYDVLPDESYKWHYVIRVFEAIAERYGYKELITPIFEKADLFERSVGDTTDIVEKEMYRFKDRKGRVFALRPEGTASVVRSYIENNLQHNPQGNRLYYKGAMFRYDRPQKGRYRQFYQYGIENFGSSHAYTDAEVIALGYNFFKELGLKDFVLEINSIGTSKTSAAYDEALVNYFNPYKERLCSDCVKRLQKNAKRVLDCKVAGCRELAAEAPSMLDYLDAESAEHFAAVQNYLKDMEIPFTVNARIVRGLDYYSRTAFEYIYTGLGAQNALGGGGRYDTLVEQMGGKPTAGIGFAGGLERLILTMEEQNLSFGAKPHPQIFLVTMGEKAEALAVKLSADLRRNGVVTSFEIEKKSLGAQMKAAGKSEADYSVLIGDDEIERNIATVKNLKTGEQIEVPLPNLINWSKNLS